jgi:hemolysin D
MKHLVEGVRAFASRYATVFLVAWSARNERPSPERSADERAFLPAHLELIETPASPTARWTARFIIGCFCAGLAWACIGQLDIVAVAPGRTVADSRTKVVQPAETAVVRRILVRDGQVVRRGEHLIELDATATGAEHALAREGLLEARLEAMRLDALAQSLEISVRPRLSDAPGMSPQRVQAERALAQSQFDAYQAKRHALEAAVEQRRAELRTARDSIGPLAESARISRVRAEDYGRLVEGRYVGRHEFLLREQERIAAERVLETQRNRLDEIQSAISATDGELRTLITETRQQVLAQLREANERIARFTPEVAKTEQRDSLMVLRAPVDGTVQQLAVHTVGGVVTPAQALVAVVPSNEALEVEATVLNKDIGFVRPGQQVTVKVESFPYTRYGYLTGTVASVSHDAAQDEHLGLVFPARVTLSNSTLDIDGVEVGLTPGMSLSLEIKTGKRRVIDYLLSPLRQHTREALRER